MRRARIFISYAREDGAAALRLYKSLQAVGFEPWIDQVDLLPGQRWREGIRRALRETDFFVGCLSGRSVSKKGFFQAELKEALEILKLHPSKDVFLVPAQLEDCEVPDEFEELNWVRLDEENGFRRLCEAFRYRAQERGLALPTGEAVASAEAIWNGAIGTMRLARLRIHFQGAYFFFDIPIEIYLDKDLAATGTLKTGVDSVVDVAIGKHEMLFKQAGSWAGRFPDWWTNRSYEFELERASFYEARLEYNRFRKEDFRLVVKELT